MKIDVLLSAEVFRRFTVFDILKLRRRWQSPVIFAALMSGFAAIAFLMRKVDGAVFLGSVLLIVGLGIPIVYFISFFASLQKQVTVHGLSRPQQVYSLELQPKAEGIIVDNGREHAVYRWKDTFHAYRDLMATYLYITPERAFILPDTCAEDPEALWALICKMLPADRCTNLVSPGK